LGQPAATSSLGPQLGSIQHIHGVVLPAMPATGAGSLR
jgi:hypothetical protein